MAEKKSEAVVRDIKRVTRRKYSAEEKITIVLEGLRGEESISAICRREGIALVREFSLWFTSSNGPGTCFVLPFPIPPRIHPD